MSENLTIVDGKLYREVKRRAKAGELIKYVWPGKQSCTHVVTGKLDEGAAEIVPFEDEDGEETVGIAHEAYVVLEPIEYDRLIADIAKLAGNYVDLSTKYAQLEKRIAELERKPVDKPKLTREDVIERAKADYLGLKLRRGLLRLEVVVNREKRTVVALLRNSDSNSVVGRGIAKCAPNDCFNVYIGKAIALRRALDLPVPDEYLNAPQPEKSQVGDIVRIEDGTTRRVIEEYRGAVIGETCQEGSVNALYGIVIDDSRDDDEKEAYSL